MTNNLPFATLCLLPNRKLAMTSFSIDTPIPEHLLPFEKAARIYCAGAGLDADHTVKVPHPIITNTLVDSWPQWTDTAQRMFELSALLSAMKTAKEQASVIVQ